MSAIAHDAVVLALNYQNEMLHPDGRTRLGVAPDGLGRASVVEAATRLLVGARARGIPVISIRGAYRHDHADVIQNGQIYRDLVANRMLIEGSWGAAFYDDLGPVAGEFIVTHRRSNAFLFSPLEAYIRCLNGHRLIIAGVATNSCVESTVRHASDVGYDVHVAADACISGDPSLHSGSLRNMAFIADVSDVATLVG
jgi:nicotinamidase-related amidase